MRTSEGLAESVAKPFQTVPSPLLIVSALLGTIGAVRLVENVMGVDISATFEVGSLVVVAVLVLAGAWAFEPGTDAQDAGTLELEAPKDAPAPAEEPAVWVNRY